MMSVQKRYIYNSLALHIVVFLLCVFDIPFLTGKPKFDEQPPIIIDLEDVKISDVTNLPEKAVVGEERKPHPNQSLWLKRLLLKKLSKKS